MPSPPRSGCSPAPAVDESRSPISTPTISRDSSTGWPEEPDERGMRVGERPEATRPRQRHAASRTRNRQQRRLHRGEHPGPRGPRGRSPPAGHVHRLDRCPRPPSPRLGSRRQLDRRGDGRARHADRRDDQAGRQPRERGRRPRRAGRQDEADRQGRPRGGPHRASRRRQVRWRRLQGLRRSPRRRRERRQRAVRVDARRVSARRQGLGAGIRSRQAAGSRGGTSGPSNGRHGTTTMFKPDAQVFETRRLQLRDDRPASARVGVPEQGRAHPPGRRARRAAAREELLLRGRPRQLRPPSQQGQGRHPVAPDLDRPTRWPDVDRGRDPVQRQLHRDGPCLCEQHQHRRRRHARRGLPCRPDHARSTTGRVARGSSRTPAATCPATTSAKA